MTELVYSCKSLYCYVHYAHSLFTTLSVCDGTGKLGRLHYSFVVALYCTLEAIPIKGAARQI